MPQHPVLFRSVPLAFVCVVFFATTAAAVAAFVIVVLLRLLLLCNSTYVTLINVCKRQRHNVNLMCLGCCDSHLAKEHIFHVCRTLTLRFRMLERDAPQVLSLYNFLE